MFAAEPWQSAEVSGPKRASVIPRSEVVATMIRKAKHPVLVVGNKAAEIDLQDKKLIDLVIELAEKTKISTVATANVLNEFLKRQFSPSGWMPAVDIGNRLIDQEWKGIDGKGQHDLALFIGLPYYMESTILSGLKHFAPRLKTITLDNRYHPNAGWSFSNMSVKDWTEKLKVLIRKSGEGGV